MPLSANKRRTIREFYDRIVEHIHLFMITAFWIFQMNVKICDGLMEFSEPMNTIQIYQNKTKNSVKEFPTNLAISNINLKRFRGIE